MPPSVTPKTDSMASNEHQDANGHQDATRLVNMTKFKPLPGVTRIMVTGGAGFIGSWLVQGFLNTYAECYEMVMFDKAELSANMQELEARPNFTFVQGDVTSQDDVMECLRKYRIDAILHLAALANVDASFKRPYDFSQLNFHGTHVLLESARACEIKRFFFVSTDTVYGKLNGTNVSEDCLLDPTTPYAATKAAAEMLVNSYCKSFGLPTVIVRPNNIYGPYQFPDKIIPKFTLLLNRGLKLPLYGSGMSTRRYLYVGDAANAFNTIFHCGTAGEVYNLGSRDQISNRDLCLALVKLVDPPINGHSVSDGWIQSTADRANFDRGSGVNDAKLRSLGWEQKVSLDEGLRRTVDWYLTHGESWWGDIGKVLVPTS
ncbi:MAG: hypothetical protein M1816_004688 [Peltula sp. TS41687]|nr:MAG: hypothetical protein M1816_004688 [Peltula sp. TS41687]